MGYQQTVVPQGFRVAHSFYSSTRAYHDSMGGGTEGVIWSTQTSSPNIRRMSDLPQRLYLEIAYVQFVSLRISPRSIESADVAYLLESNQEVFSSNTNVLF